MRDRFQSRDRIYEVSLERQGEAYRAVVDGQAFDLELIDSQAGVLTVRFNGRPAIIYYAPDGSSLWLSQGGCTYRMDKPSQRRNPSTGEAGGGQAVHSPMPAQVRAVQVGEGDVVEKGDTLLLLEAMKMEIRVKSPAAGRVKRLLVSNGQAVERDQILAEIGD